MRPLFDPEKSPVTYLGSGLGLRGAVWVQRVKKEIRVLYSAQGVRGEWKPCGEVKGHERRGAQGSCVTGEEESRC